MIAKYENIFLFYLYYIILFYYLFIIIICISDRILQMYFSKKIIISIFSRDENKEVKLKSFT